MKLAAMMLFLCAGAALSQGAFAVDEARLVQQRIDRLEDEQYAINRESHDLAGGQSVSASVSATSYNRDTISRQIDSLDGAIGQMETLADDLVRSRAQRAERNLYTREDGREELAQTAVEEVLLIGVSEAAKRYAGIAGGVAFAGETLYRIGRKWENLSQLDELIATNNRNLGELRAMRTRLEGARGEELRKLARLEELRRRDRQVFGELAEARAQLARLQPQPKPQPSAAAPPARKPVASAPPPPAARPPAERTIYPMQLVGAWTGTGYNCNGAEADEFIFITYTPEDGLVATKSLGDECIHSTEVTWTGKLEGKQIRGRLHVRARNAPSNADSWLDGTLEVVSPNEIRGFGVTFHRPAVR